MEKVTPGQERLFCKQASRQQLSLFRATGHPKACMNPNLKIGVNTIDKMMREACKRAGLGDVKGHSLWRLFCTTLANAPGVSMAECLASSCHSSVSGVLPYQKRSHTSEVAKIEALLSMKLKRAKTKESKMKESKLMEESKMEELKTDDPETEEVKM